MNVSEVLKWVRAISSNEFQARLKEELSKKWIFSIIGKDGVDEFDETLPYYKRYKFHKYFPVKNDERNRIIFTLDLESETLLVERAGWEDTDGTIYFPEALGFLPLEECVDLDAIQNGILRSMDEINREAFQRYRRLYRQRLERIRKENKNA
ncbi:MAG: hypothetical protein N3A54_00580 [Patescibacteria group bacterium]|nr:hypothetical protein [Patescibacteria group bacterium]